MTWWYISGFKRPHLHRSGAVLSKASDIGPDSDKSGCDSTSTLYLGAGLALSNIKMSLRLFFQ
jgi:hypothetical protein